jgi:hypothetical protein
MIDIIICNYRADSTHTAFVALYHPSAGLSQNDRLTMDEPGACACGVRRALQSFTVITRERGANDGCLAAAAAVC